MNVKVSVCIPVYGVEKYIERCARSLFEQTMRNGVEFVFVNDCTPDKSIEILEHVLAKYPHRKEQTKIINLPENGGVGRARRIAIENCTGEYIIHCDPDDWIEPDMYEKMYCAAMKTGADVSYCFHFLDDDRNIKKTVAMPAYSTGEELLTAILRNNLHWGLWSKMIKAEIVKNPDLYQPEHICFGEDLLLVAQMLAQSGKVVCCPEPLYHYVKNNSSSYTRAFKHSSWLQLREAVDFLEQHLPGQYNIAACKGEVLFKAIFYDLTDAADFRQYARTWRKKILSAPDFSNIKKLILLSSFVSFRATRLFLLGVRRLS